jgi:hypothetical protein
VVAYGLKSSVMEVSGELSITSDRLAFEFAELFEPEPEPEDPHALSPTARTPAAATVMSLLCSTNLLMCLRLSCRGYVGVTARAAS